MASHGGLAEVLRSFGPAYLATHTLSLGEAKAWRAILACRTAALGGHIECCDPDLMVSCCRPIALERPVTACADSPDSP